MAKKRRYIEECHRELGLHIPLKEWRFMPYEMQETLASCVRLKKKLAKKKRRR